jgi:hypothetical protein
LVARDGPALEARSVPELTVARGGAATAVSTRATHQRVVVASNMMSGGVDRKLGHGAERRVGERCVEHQQ